MHVKKILMFYLSLMSSAMCPSHRSFALEAQEHEIKATYLYNFAKFTNWPAQKLPTGDHLAICISGGDPFKGALANLVRGKSIENHPLEVRHLDSVERAGACNILYVPASEVQNFLKIRGSRPLQNTLTVGETRDFLDSGGQIQFYTEDNRVKFAIDLTAVERAGLKIDARVLNIARIRR